MSLIKFYTLLPSGQNYTCVFVLQGFLELLEPTEVFACESGTMFLHQDENFFLAVGRKNILTL